MRTVSTEEDLRTLELDPGATREDIRRAWRDLTQVWHPDRFAHDEPLRQKAEERLKRINAAYQRLSVARAEPRRVPQDATGRTWGTWIAAGIAALLLLRRPTLGGLLTALAVFLALTWALGSGPRRG